MRIPAIPERTAGVNRYKLFAVGAIGTFMSTLDGSILNVALPTIATNFNADVDVVAWVVLAYSLTVVSLMMVFGAWAGRKGYGFAYRFGYLLFLTGSALCAASWSIYSLIVARVLQATGGAMFQAIGPGMVTQVFPENERGKGIGMMTMIVGAGLMTGPVVGGFMLSIWPWRSLFIINIPIGLFALWFGRKYFGMLPAERANRKLKLMGATCLSVGLLAMMLGMSFLNDFGLGDPRVWGIGMVSLAALAAFVWIESKPDRALIGLDIFRNRVFSSSIAAMLALYTATSGVLILIPFYLERIKHLEPREVGLYLMILPLLLFIFAPLAGRLSDRIGYRFLTMFGVLSSAFGLFLLMRLDPNSPGSYLVLSLVVIGMGSGVFNTPNSSALMGSVRDDQRAVASGILATSRNMGMSLGVSLATALFAYFQVYYSRLGDPNQAFMASYHVVITLSTAIALVGLPFCVIRGNRVR